MRVGCRNRGGEPHVKEYSAHRHGGGGKGKRRRRGASAVEKAAETRERRHAKAMIREQL
jgi:hypothetical protein